MYKCLCLASCLLGLLFASVTHANTTSEDISAKTVHGDAVILHPNGYWEYVDADKAAAAKTKVEAIAREEGCPKGTRASFFGVGRCIPNGDPSLRQGSRSGKGW